MNNQSNSTDNRADKNTIDRNKADDDKYDSVNVSAIKDKSASNVQTSNLHSSNLHASKLVRWFFVLCGCLAFAIGMIGIVVPLLPTTPLVILAAACWAKGSERFHNWLLTHRLFGKMVLDWRDRRAIPKYAKYLAWSMMTISCCMIFYRVPADWQWLGWVSVAFSLSVAIWMARLPDA